MPACSRIGASWTKICDASMFLGGRTVHFMTETIGEGKLGGGPPLVLDIPRPLLAAGSLIERCIYAGTVNPSQQEIRNGKAGLLSRTPTQKVRLPGPS